MNERYAGGVIDAERVSSQLCKGVLEYCVLSMLSRQALHGFALQRLVEEGDALSGTRAATYAILGRLSRQGLIVGVEQGSTVGPTRKVYATTPAGDDELVQFRTLWRRFCLEVDMSLGGAHGSRR